MRFRLAQELGAASGGSVSKPYTGLEIMRSLALMLSSVLLVWGLSGCKDQQKDKENLLEAVSNADGHGRTVEAKSGGALSGGRLVLPAVKGNPGAAYFTYANRGSAGVAIVTISVAGSDKAEMHTTADGKMAALRTLAIPAGETVKFAPGGNHAMVFGLAPNVIVGGDAELTIAFADGTKLSAPLKVEAAGGEMDMAH